MSGKRFVFAAFSGMWVIFHVFTSLVVNFEDNRLRFFEGIDVALESCSPQIEHGDW